MKALIQTACGCARVLDVSEDLGPGDFLDIPTATNVAVTLHPEEWPAQLAAGAEFRRFLVVHESTMGAEPFLVLEEHR